MCAGKDHVARTARADGPRAGSSRWCRLQVGLLFLVVSIGIVVSVMWAHDFHSCPPLITVVFGLYFAFVCICTSMSQAHAAPARQADARRAALRAVIWGAGQRGRSWQ